MEINIKKIALIFLLGAVFQAHAMYVYLGENGLGEIEQLAMEYRKEEVERKDRLKKVLVRQLKNTKECHVRLKKLQEYKQRVLNEMLDNAIRGKDEDTMHRCLALGVKVGVKVNDKAKSFIIDNGTKWLFKSVMEDCPYLARILLEFGVDPRSRDAFQQGPIGCAKDYNLAIYLLMAKMSKFFDSYNKSAIIFGEMIEEDQASMIRFLINTEDAYNLIATCKTFDENNNFEDFLYLVDKHRISQKSIENLLKQEPSYYSKISDQFKKKRDYTDLIVRKYKTNVDRYVNYIVLSKHKMLAKFYANGGIMEEKEKYKELSFQDQCHVFYDTAWLSKEQIFEIIKYLQLKANEYYIVYQKSAYSDTFAPSVFEKFSNELVRLAKQAGVDLLSFAPSYSAPESFAKKMIETYKKFTKEELDEKRKFWQSESWKSLLKNDKNCAWLIENVAKKVCEQSNNNIIVCLGQSPAYWVMTAEILDLLKGNKERKYWYIPFSGSFCGDLKLKLASPKFIKCLNKATDEELSVFKNELDFSIDPLYSSLYKQFLSKSGFFAKDNNILVCEQLETGLGLKSFLGVMPFKKYSLFLNEYGDIYANMALKLFSEFKEKIEGSFVAKENFAREVLDELMATYNETMRLVAQYPKCVWLFADPHSFKPGKEAEERILRIIDYIYTSGFVKN